MTVSVRDSYLESQVLTATPQKLRLMLIEGALRFAHQVVTHWENARFEDAGEAVVRCRQIITELLTVIDDDGSEMIGQLRGIYLFMFRHLTAAHMQQNPEMVEEVIRLLEVERETWQLVCEQMPEAPQRESQAARDTSREITASHTHADGGDQMALSGFDSSVLGSDGECRGAGGFSLDA